MGTSSSETTSELNCGDLPCPLPIVKLAVQARKLPVGTRIRVRARDPRFDSELRAWSEISGHQIESLEVGAEQVAVVRLVATTDD